MSTGSYSSRSRKAQERKPLFRFFTGKKGIPPELTYLPRIVYSLLAQGYSLKRIEAEQGIHRATARKLIKEVLEPLALVKKGGPRWTATEPPKEWFTYTRKGKPAYLRVIAVPRFDSGRSPQWAVRLLLSYLKSIAQTKRQFWVSWRGTSYYARVLGLSRKSVQRAKQSLCEQELIERSDDGKVIINSLKKQWGDHSQVVTRWCSEYCPTLYEKVMAASDGWELTKVAEKLAWVVNNWNRDRYPTPIGLVERVFRRGGTL
jgi:hypothetical protein